ncbi:protoporphyrinogen oxidase HemJ [Acetobacteraceae bacterium]|nr:protoporphyrinogen oxidase HemJ [Acetobacteraceae bacterium]
MAYLPWLLAFHIMSFIAWMAGIFYLPRLFVYHSQVSEAEEPKAYERYCVMEHKLLRQIMAPAMVFTLITGAIMSTMPGVIVWDSCWWWVKLVSVLGLIIFQGFCFHWQKQFLGRNNRQTERFYRVINEIPTLLMMIIVLMICIRP